MSKQRIIRLIVSAVLVVVVTAAGYRSGWWGEAASSTTSARDAIAAVQVQTLDGKTVSLADLREKVVLVNFWATWCSTCRSEMPGFQSVYNGYRDRDFTILALSVDETGPGTVREFFEEHGYTFPVAMVTDEAKRSFGVTGVPVSFLLDRNGEIRKVVHGAFHEADLQAAVQELLAEESTASVVTS